MQRIARILGPASPSFTANTDVTGFYLYDSHGDVRSIVPQVGNPLLTLDYDPWGNVTDRTGTWDNPFGYSGEQTDATGMQYLRARYYNPQISRMMTEDTYTGEFMEPGSQNRYAYVQNNPLKYTDPTGHFVNALARALFRPIMRSISNSLGNIRGSLGRGFQWADNGLAAYDAANALAHASEPCMTIWQRIETVASIGLGIPGIKKSGGGPSNNSSSTGFGGGSNKSPKPDGNANVECNCFTAGTKVLTDEGEKNIEDIEVGDMVLAKDENNPDGELAYKEVTKLYRNQRDDIIKLYVGEQVIETTDNHPFWVEGKGWMFADELQVGNKLQKADGSNLIIDKIEFVKLDKPVTVYNFTVADFHTYYVTNLGIWVHNTKCSNSKLSSPNPLPKTIREQYEEIILGGGTPRIDSTTGKQKVFNANELKNKSGGGTNVWAGSLEYDVPGTNHRILKRPDGKLGYVLNHDYSQPKLFPGPWYPEGGK
ncbi:polymorphic toxin-type HINT domain-containing protein [Paenibacillus sp. GCM10027627]